MSLNVSGDVWEGCKRDKAWSGSQRVDIGRTLLTHSTGIVIE